MAIDQISVFVENKPGRLVELLEVLGQNHIDLRAMSLADTADFGIVRIITNNPASSKQIIEDAGYVTSITQVLAVAVPDSPGGLASALRALSDGGCSVEYIYAFITHESGKASVIIRVDDNDKASATLEAAGISQLQKSDVYHD